MSVIPVEALTSSRFSLKLTLLLAGQPSPSAPYDYVFLRLCSAPIWISARLFRCERVVSIVAYIDPRLASDA